MEESPAKAVNPSRAAEAKAFREAQVRKKQPKQKGVESYKLVGNKVVKITRMPDGKVYSVYTCRRDEADKRGLKYEK